MTKEKRTANTEPKKTFDQVLAEKLWAGIRKVFTLENACKVAGAVFKVAKYTVIGAKNIVVGAVKLMRGNPEKQNQQDTVPVNGENVVSVNKEGTFVLDGRTYEVRCVGSQAQATRETDGVNTRPVQTSFVGKFFGKGERS